VRTSGGPVKCRDGPEAGPAPQLPLLFGPIVRTLALTMACTGMNLAFVASAKKPFAIFVLPFSC